VKAAAPSVDDDSRGSESPIEPGVGLEPPAAWTALTVGCDGVEQGVGEADDLQGLDVAPAAHVRHHQVAAVDLEHVADAAVEVVARG